MRRMTRRPFIGWLLSKRSFHPRSAVYPEKLVTKNEVPAEL
jgi:hypothetical protein